jgi:GntR family transcriptional regulator, rspAB operon transcriptional repressor
MSVKPGPASEISPLDKVRKVDLVGSTVAILRSAIITGQIPAATRITEMQLASEMGISRSTLRTALLELEKADLVVRTPFSAWAVPKPTVQMIWEVYTLRATLEGLATRLVSENLDTGKETAIRQAFDQLIETERDPSSDTERMRVDLQFHRTIVGQAGHERLLKHYDVLLDKIAWVYSWTDAHHDLRIDLPEWHRPIFDAIMARRPEDAEKAVRAVVSAAYRDVSAALAAGTEGTTTW